MKVITIGLVQTKVSDIPALNVKKTIKFIKQAVKKGARIICLQELFQTPYFPQRTGEIKSKYAEFIPGTTTEIMKNLAKKLRVAIVVPIFERTNEGKYFNTVVVFGHNGKILGKYRKIHIPNDPGFYEKEYFEQGDLGYKIFKTKFGNFAVLICYDQWFPEAATLSATRSKAIGTMLGRHLCADTP